MTIKRYLASKARRVLNALLPGHPGLEALDAVTARPYTWDQAAVDLDELRGCIRGVGYAQYLYGLLSAARTARAVDCAKFTAIEFGVAGGNGLLAMEKHAAAVEQRYGVSIDIIGFDMSTGLPSRTDPRDCPFAFSGGEFAMDEQTLRARLTRASLRLGDVKQTVSSLMAENFAPIGFVSHDLDMYTSTKDSLVLLTQTVSRFLPRVTMYFDDLNGYPYTTVTGEWAAIAEYNAAFSDRAIGRINGLRFSLGRRYRFAPWAESMFLLHFFAHPGYNLPETTVMPCLGLR